MMWEIVAIWAIVLGVFVWFFRDERKRRAQAQPALFRRAGIAVPAGEPSMDTRVKVDPAALDETRRKFIDALAARND